MVEAPATATHSGLGVEDPGRLCVEDPGRLVGGGEGVAHERTSEDQRTRCPFSLCVDSRHVLFPHRGLGPDVTEGESVNTGVATGERARERERA